MKRFIVGIHFYQYMDYEVEAETDTEAIEKAHEWAKDFPIDAKEIEYEINDCTEDSV